MKCAYPIERYQTYRGNRYRISFACGRCAPCIVNRRQDWVARMLMERQLHSKATFTTLTYDDGHLPEHRSLSVRDYQQWMRRLRAYLPRVGHSGKVRYFVCGEYGSKTGRPHYHAILYGVSPAEMQWLDERFPGLWPHGFTKHAQAHSGSMAYVAKYVAKKVTEDLTRSWNYDPDLQMEPFIRMSRNPGIGAGYAPYLVEALSTEGQNVEEVIDRTKGIVRISGRWYRIPMYILQKMYLHADPEYDARKDREKGLRLLIMDCATRELLSSRELILADIEDRMASNRSARRKLGVETPQKATPKEPR